MRASHFHLLQKVSQDTRFVGADVKSKTKPDILCSRYLGIFIRSALTAQKSFIFHEPVGRETRVQ